jgi:hypothetical protein
MNWRTYGDDRGTLFLSQVSYVDINNTNMVIKR